MEPTIFELGEIAILVICVYLLVKAISRFVELQNIAQDRNAKIAQAAIDALNESNVQTDLMRRTLQGVRRDNKRTRVVLGQLTEVGTETLRLAQLTSEDTKKLPETMTLEIIKAMSPILSQMGDIVKLLNDQSTKGDSSLVILESLSRMLGETRVEIVGQLEVLADEAGKPRLIPDKTRPVVIGSTVSPLIQTDEPPVEPPKPNEKSPPENPSGENAV